MSNSEFVFRTPANRVYWGFSTRLIVVFSIPGDRRAASYITCTMYLLVPSLNLNFVLPVFSVVVADTVQAGQLLFADNGPFLYQLDVSLLVRISVVVVALVATSK
jgi:hypothetical protein